MDELHIAFQHRGLSSPELRFGWTLGECDWYAELQRLLYDER